MLSSMSEGNGHSTRLITESWYSLAVLIRLNIQENRCSPLNVQLSTFNFQPSTREPHVKGKADESREGVDAELAHEALAVAFDGADADFQVVGGFTITESFG